MNRPATNATGAPRPGDLLLRDATLTSVEIDVARGSIRLVTSGGRVEFDGVRATTILAPWDGTPGTIERLEVVAADGGELCLELRVRYAEVPRVHRIVCASLRRC